MKWLKNRLGFTLIELVVVGAILGVMAAIALSAFQTHHKKQVASTPTEQVDPFRNLP